MRQWLLYLEKRYGSLHMVAEEFNLLERHLYRTLHESNSINFWKADEILTRTHGPSIFTMYPDWQPPESEAA